MTISIRTVHVLGLAMGLGLGLNVLGEPIGGQATAPAQTPPPAGAGRQGGRGGNAPPESTQPKQLLEGTEKDDTVSGGDGDDWIFGQKGNDFLQGGGGRDKIDGGEGDDTIDGGAGDDVIDSGAGSDTVRSGEGDDFIDGGDEADLLDGGTGVDDIDGGDGNDIIRGAAGNDVLVGGDENDTIEGGGGNDQINGEDGDDSLSGGAGDDILMGSEGNDTLVGEAGDDRLDGGVENDVLRGAQGADTLLGSLGNDTLQGDQGDDTLIGGDGSDTLSGGFGHDWILGGPGTDSSAGNEGDDLFILRAGDVPAGEVETINGGAGTDVLILNGFGKNPDPLFPGSAAPGSMGPAGERQLVDPVTGGVYRLINVERVEYTQMVADLADSADRPVSVLLVNPSATASTGRLIFFGADGSIVPPVVKGNQPARDDVVFTVPPFGSVRVDTVVRGSVVAQVFAPTPLGAIVRSSSAAGTPPLSATPIIDSAFVPVVENRAAGVSTGFLIANSVTQSTIKLTLYALDGEELDGETFFGMKEIVMPAYSHRVFFVRDLFPRLTDFQGALTIDGGDGDRPQEGGPISVVVLERGAGGRVVTSPPFSMFPSTKRDPVHVAGFSSGGDSIVLVNPSPNTTTKGTLRFYDEAGQPWAVSVNRQPPATSVMYDLDSLGSAVFTATATGPPQRGTARAESTEGVLGGLVRITTADKSVTRVPASDTFSSFITAIRRDGASGATTRVSLSSAGSPLSLRLTLRNADGATVAGNPVEIRLPQNGHATRTLEQLFPSVGPTFEGTLTVVADGGTVAATVVEVDQASLTPSPVVPLP